MADNPDNFTDVNDQEMDSDVDSSDSDNEEQENEMLQRKNLLLNQLQADQTDYNAYVDLIQVYDNLSDIDGLRQTCEAFSLRYPLTSELWLKWIDVERRIAASVEEKQKVLTLFQRALDDYQSMDVWFDFISSSISLASNNEFLDVTRGILERAVDRCGCHVIQGSLLWGSYRDIEKGLLQQQKIGNNSEENLEQIRLQKLKIINLYLRELSLPLLHFEETLAEFKTWLDSESVTNEVDMEKLEIDLEQTSKILVQLLPFEEKLETVARDESYKVYEEYLSFEKNNFNCGNSRHRQRIFCLFERAIVVHPLRTELWSEYLAFVTKLNDIVPEDKERIYNRALRNCPGHAEFWCQYLVFLERRGKSKDDIKGIFEKSREQRIETASGYRTIWFSYIHYLRRQLSALTDDKDLYQSVVDEIRESVEIAYEELNTFYRSEGDPECELYLWLARFEAEVVRDLPLFRQIWSDKILSSNLCCKAWYWHRYVAMEWQYGDAKHIRRYCNKAIEKVTDNPEPVFKIWLEYESLNGSLDSYLRCQTLCKEKLQKYKEEFEKRKPKFDLKKNQAAGKSENKLSKHTGKEIKVKAKETREEKGKWSNLLTAKPTKSVSAKPEVTGTSVVHDPSKDDQTIFVSNLDYSVTEDDVKKVLDPAGKIIDFRLVRGWNGKSKGYAYVVFSSEEETEAALKLDRIPVNQRPMFISRCKANKTDKQTGIRFKTGLEKNKLFVSNLPVSWDKKAVEDLFSPYGKIRDVRIVTYRNGHSKGLAYVDFDSEESAAHALVKIDGREIEGKHVAVAISNPPQRKNNSSLFVGGGDPAAAADSLGNGAIAKSSFGSRGRGRTQLSFVPSQLSKFSSTKSEDIMDTSEPQQDVFKKPMSNADFKNFLLKK